MPSQIYVLLGVEDGAEDTTLDGYRWPIAEAFASLDAAVQAIPSHSSTSATPVLITCFQEEALRAVAASFGTNIGGLQLSYPEGVEVKTCKSEHLAIEAGFLIRSGVAAVGEEETLTVILCGHGDTEGKFSAGQDLLTKNTLEGAVYQCKGKVVVVYTGSTNCAHWASEEWELVAVVSKHEESEHIVVQESEGYHGHYPLASPALHYPRESTKGDSKWRSVDELVTKMNAFRLASNRSWTSSDDEEMLQLSISIQQQSLSTVASNVHILCCSLWYLAGGDKRERIRSFKHKKPLIFLRKHEALRKRAQGIAKMMEWDTTIDPLMLDGPVKRDLIKEACEVGGCDVNIVTFKGGWLEPAYWLARLWKAAGEVPVDKQKWDKAVAATADIEYLSII